MSDRPPRTEKIQTVEFRGGGFVPKPVRWVGLVMFIVLIVIFFPSTTHFTTDLITKSCQDNIKLVVF